MPSLADLSKALAPADIAVLPLSADRGGVPIVRKWFDSHEISALPILLDPKGLLAQAVNARGVPTTLIVNKSGVIVAKLEGPADWGSPDAAALVRSLTGS
jgi:hypothetical protein